MKSYPNHNVGHPIHLARAAACLLAVFAFLATTLSTSTPANAFEIRVRAQSQLTVDVNTAGTNLQLYGHLRDDLQQALPQRQVVVHITPASQSNAIEQGDHLEHTLLTDRRGHFQLTRELPPDFYHVAVEFYATEHLDAAVSLHDVEIKQHPVELSVRAPAYVHTRNTPAPIAVHALAQQTGLSTEILIQRNDTTLGSIQLDRFGRGTFDVSHNLQPGINTLEAVLPANQYRTAVRQPMSIRAGTQLVLNARSQKVLERLVRGISISGNVLDESGPIPNIQVRAQLSALPQPDSQQPPPVARSGFTDQDGAFHIFISNAELPDANWSILAEVIPDVGPTVSQTVEPIDLDRTLSRTILQTSAAIVALALLLRILQRLTTHINARRRARKQRTEATDAIHAALRNHETMQIIPITDELQHLIETNPNNQPSQTPPTQTIAGITWDPWKKLPVPHATLTAQPTTPSDSTRQTLYKSDARGRFLIENLPPDSYTLSVHAHGFIPATLSFDIPHDGVLAKIRLDLVAVPLKIRQAYQAAIQTIQGEDLWGIQTPRQINELISRVLTLDPDTQAGDLAPRLADAKDNPAEVLRALTEIVEESYFSGRQYNEELWNIARELALEIIQFARQHNASQESL